ncbi:conjugal transfer protein TraN, partial [Burkholderia multivorans]|uniref:conjugal transfer protein TraN n=1 Tax=Burkholderia multivorans TaxID=87883 RepID=UPI002870227F
AKICCSCSWLHFLKSWSLLKTRGDSVGTYCSKKLPIVKICIEKTKSYCCYNSRLARIINEQGRAQIGKGWGSAESPNCAGLTQEEFAMIDFSRIDLSEFTSEIMANIKMPDVGSMGQQVQSAVQQKVQNYYQRGIQ